uniref:Uncharacterized protein n=1 Tax=Chelonoidis abingdonii TaxID=106734 RepID=A0A8C0GIG9_CHEAB
MAERHVSNPCVTWLLPSSFPTARWCLVFWEVAGLCASRGAVCTGYGLCLSTQLQASWFCKLHKNTATQSVPVPLQQQSASRCVPSAWQNGSRPVICSLFVPKGSSTQILPRALRGEGACLQGRRDQNSEQNNQGRHCGILAAAVVSTLASCRQ